MSQPSQAAGAEYRVAELDVLRAGADLALVYSHDRAAAGFYRAELVELLLGCQQFRTIEQHAEQHTQRSGTPAAALRRELLRLARAGFLICRDDLAAPADGPEPALPPISSVTFPTRDRVEVLHRAIGSYARNWQRTGRQVEIVVADDSPDPATRARYRAMLAGQVASHRVPISYAGAEQKLAYANQLAEAAGLPLELVRFGCLGDPAAGVTIGANRNTLLLHTVGERILSADDDTVCAVAPAPGQRPGVQLDSSGNPLQLWFFGSRQAALDAVSYTEQDLLSLHESYLGAGPARLLASAGPDSYDPANPALLRRSQSQPGRVRVTATGTVGDCGWDNPDFHLFQHGETLDRLVADEATFRLGSASRDLIQAVSRASITGHPDPKFAMCIGLDNLELLPPFPPVGRAEEVAFAAVLASCFPDAYGAQLPWLVQHDPSGDRHFSAGGSFALGFGSWLPAVVSRFDAGLDRSPRVRLAKLGGHLLELGRLGAAEFDEIVRFTAWDSMSSLVTGLEEALAASSPPPEFWARAARGFITRARARALVPIEELYQPVGGRQSLQDLLTSYGQLLNCWPAMVDAAHELRAGGVRLAQPVLGLA